MAQTVHAPTLLIDHEHRRVLGDPLHLGYELVQLLRVADVAAEQDDRVRTVLGDDLPLEVRQGFASQADA